MDSPNAGFTNPKRKNIGSHLIKSNIKPYKTIYIYIYIHIKHAFQLQEDWPVVTSLAKSRERPFGTWPWISHRWPHEHLCRFPPRPVAVLPRAMSSDKQTAPVEEYPRLLVNINNLIIE